MNNDKQFDGALCAGVGTADVAAAAPAEGKKKYVSPTMQVIPLGPQRLLQTSNAPVHVTVAGSMTMYGFACETYLPPEITCDDFTTAGFFDSRIPLDKEANTCGDFNRCFYPSDWETSVKFGPGGEDWSEADFLANVQFHGGCSFPAEWEFKRYAVSIGYDGRIYHDGSGSVGMISGEYRGRAVEVEFLLGSHNTVCSE